MRVDKVEIEENTGQSAPFRSDRPLDSSWPNPTLGLPIPGKRGEARVLRLILERLVQIEGRLDRIEKLLSGKPAKPARLGEPEG